MPLQILVECMQQGIYGIIENTLSLSQIMEQAIKFFSNW